MKLGLSNYKAALLAGALMLTSAARGQFDDGVLTNGGMDAFTGGMANNWLVNHRGRSGEGLTGEQRYGASDTQFQVGLLSQRITAGAQTNEISDSYVRFTQHFPTTRGMFLNALVWIKVSAGSMKFQVVLNDGASFEKGALGAKTITIAAGNWTQVGVTGFYRNYTGESTAALEVRCFTPGTFYVDSARVVASSDAVALNTTKRYYTGHGNTLISPAYFGLNFLAGAIGGANPESPRAWPNDLAPSLMRMWDSWPATWDEIQPNGAGDAEFTAFDIYTRVPPNVRISDTLGGATTPLWARKNPAGGANQLPKDIPTWQQYVRKVATQYNVTVPGQKGAIKYWEVWNEADGSGFNAEPMNMKYMVQIAKGAWDVLKAPEFSGNTVMTPNFTTSGLSHLERFLEAGGGQYADKVALHVYLRGHSPDTLGYFNHMRNMKEMLKRFPSVTSKEIWCTEGGGSNPKDVALQNIMAWATGMKHFDYYAYDVGTDPDTGLSYGLLNDINGRYEAYKRSRLWLLNKAMPEIIRYPDDIWEARLTNSSGALLASIFWRDAPGSRNLTRPAALAHLDRYVNLTGSATPITDNDGTMEITETPRYWD